MTETTWVSFRTLFSCFPLTEFSHFPFFAGFSPFLTLGYWLLFPLVRSRPWGFASSLSDQNDVLLMSSVWNSSVVRCFEYSLVHTEPIQSEAEQNPEILTNPPGPFPKVFHLRLTELRPILSRIPEHHHSVSVYWIDLMNLVQLHKLQWVENVNVCNLPPS